MEKQNKRYMKEDVRADQYLGKNYLLNKKYKMV